MRADVGDKVILEKYPRAANLDAGDMPLLSPLAQDFFVYMEKGACLVQVEGVHGAWLCEGKGLRRCSRLFLFWSAAQVKRLSERSGSRDSALHFDAAQSGRRAIWHGAAVGPEMSWCSVLCCCCV